MVYSYTDKQLNELNHGKNVYSVNSEYAERNSVNSEYAERNGDNNE